MKSPAYTVYYNPTHNLLEFYKHSTQSKFSFFPGYTTPYAIRPHFQENGRGWTPPRFYERIVEPNTLFTAQSRNDLIGKCSRKYLLKHHPEILL